MTLKTDLTPEEKEIYRQRLQQSFDNYDALAVYNICKDIKLRLGIIYAPIKLKYVELLIESAKLLGVKFDIIRASKLSFTDVYKGYIGQAVWDKAAKLYHGDVLNIKDAITFAGKNKKELRKAFKDSIDDYILWLSNKREKNKTK